MQTTTAWSRPKVLAILTGAGLAVLVLLAGTAAAVYLALAPQRATAPDGPAPGSAAVAGESDRDQIAAAPMLEVGAAAATAGVPSTTLAPSIEVPTPTGNGPARIATGFPRTPEGAVGQLGAILVEVVRAMSVPRAHEVYQAWSEPGAAPAQDWSMTRNVTTFLASAKIPGQDAGTRARIEVTPAAAQVKGVDGQDWVVACVLLEIDASIARSVDAAYGHCERMTWTDGRWVIAQGPAPAPAPSTWPGTDLAAEAGWRTWRSVATPGR